MCLAGFGDRIDKVLAHFFVAICGCLGFLCRLQLEAGCIQGSFQPIDFIEGLCIFGNIVPEALLLFVQTSQFAAKISGANDILFQVPDLRFQ